MKKVICPLLKKPCIEHQCAWYTTVRGYDRNTGKEIDNQECIVSTIPLLLIENSAQQRSTGSAVESMRNEIVKKSEVTNTILANIAFANDMAQLQPTPVTIAELPNS